MPAYYNEIDPYAAKWLRNLIANGHIAPGDVDERDIRDVRADELVGYEQCHFFAGIGGWSYALRLAGWPDVRPVWTGSCPCQPFSSAARGRNTHPDLWPEWSRLIAKCRPRVVFGEQVAQSGGWIDRVCDAMEAMDYQCRSAILPAVGVGADHLRNRIYFACNANGYRESGLPVDAKTSGVQRDRGIGEGMVSANGIPDSVACLRAFGNAIHPELAAEFIRACLEVAP